MKVVLAKAPRSAHGFRLSDNSEALGLSYLASTLRVGGHRVSIANGALRSTEIDSFVEMLLSPKIGLIGFTLPDPSTVLPTTDLIQRLRSLGSTAHICAGGHAATFHPQEILASIPGLDSVILRDGENALLDLAGRVADGKPLTALPGVLTRSQPSDCFRPSHFGDLDDLPFPARDDLEFVLKHLPEQGAIPVSSSRGCAFNCSFCSVQSFYNNNDRPVWRRHSLERTLDEFSELYTDRGVRDFLFVDDLFLTRSKRSQRFAREFATGLQERGLDLTFTIAATVDAVLPEAIEPLREAGLRQVFLGAESANEQLLRKLGKWFAPVAIQQAVRTLEDLDVDVSASFINFTPDSQTHHLRENGRFFAPFPSDLTQGLLNRMQMLGGTPDYSRMGSEGRLEGSFPSFEYADASPEVAAIFAASQRIFGPTVSASARLKLLQRRIRVNRISLSSEPISTIAGTRIASQLSSEVRAFMRQMNTEVLGVFESVLEGFARNPKWRVNGCPNSFLKERQSEVAEHSRRWMDTIQVLESICWSYPASTTLGEKPCEPKKTASVHTP